MSGTRLLTRGAPGWPDRLEHLEQPPDRLWLRGTAEPGRLPAVAIVGSRRATAGGITVARDLARALAESGVVIVSGFAIGIDAAAHRGALDGGGVTVAVLGCGLDQDYPPGHGELRRRVAAAGVLVTENPEGTHPEGWLFPRRNRLIAALAQAVVVVEATERSGALSTARWAVDLGRDVLAVPGSIRSPQSRGANLLIRDGARPVLEPGDVLEAIGVAVEAPVRGRGRLPTAPADPDLRAVWSRLGSDPVHPDELAEACGLDAATLGARLGALEIGGAVVTERTGFVRRAG